MKKNKALFMWAAVTAVVVAGAVFDLQWEKHETDKKLTSAKVFAADSGQIAAFEIVFQNPATVYFDGVASMTNRARFVKRPATKDLSEAWWIENPVEERANQDAVLGFVEALAQERAINIANSNDETGSQGKVEWSSFGLDQPKGSIAIFDPTGQSSTVIVGTRINFEGKAYLRRNEENQVLLGSSDWLNRIEKSLSEFRDHRILRQPAASVKFIEFLIGPKTHRFERKDEKWIFIQQPTWELDQNKVRELIGQLFGDMIMDYKREGKLTSADMKEFGLDQPTMRLRVGIDGMKEDWTATISNVRSSVVFMQINRPSMIVSVDVGDGLRMIEMDPAKLRDRHTPFNFDKAKVAEVEIRSGDSVLKAKKKGSEWSVVENSSKLPIKPEAVGQFLDRLRGLEVLDYLDKKSELTGQGTTSVSLRTGTGEPVLELVYTERQQQKIAGREVFAITASSSLNPVNFAIDENKIKDLQVNSLLYGATEPKLEETGLEDAPESAPKDANGVTL